MYVDELNIRGYGRLSNFRLEPSHGLNVLCGAAEGGKTTVSNCIRDLLLGPEQWTSTDGGPRSPYARPWNGDRFQARMRYTVGATSYTLQRDFDEVSMRVRDEKEGKEIPIHDARLAAPGVVPFRLLAPEADVPGGSDGDRLRLMEARARLVDARKEAATWEWRYNKAFSSDIEGRLRKAGEFEREIATLRPALDKYATTGDLSRENRETVTRGNARLAALEKEIADGEKALEKLRDSRRDVGTRLAQYERFYTVSPEDVEKVKALDVSEGPTPAQIEEKEKNLKGFEVKERDIQKRLDEIAPRFKSDENEDEFDARLNDNERELARSETLTAKVGERDRIDAELIPLRASGRRHLMYSAALLVVGVTLIVLEFVVPHLREHHYSLFIGIGVMAAAALPFVLKKARAGRLQQLESESARVNGDIARLKETIDISREQVRQVLEQAGVQTIKELRALHRESRALHRDSQTVKAYRKELEAELEKARQKSTQKRAETPALLVECNIVKAGEPLTSRVVADFLEAWNKFKAMQQEEENIKKQYSQLSTTLGDKTAERDQVAAAREKALQAMGLKSEADIEPAFASKREWDKINAQITALEEKVKTVMRGMSFEDARKPLQAASLRLTALEAEFPDVKGLAVAADKVEEYRANHQKAQQTVASLQSEIASLTGTSVVGTSSEQTTVIDSEQLAREVAQAWQRVSGRALFVRLSDDKGEMKVEIRDKADGAWQPSNILGRASARLLTVLVEGERARGGGVSGVPAFIDEPFEKIDTAWQERLADWVVHISQSVQTFVTLSAPEALDRLKEALGRAGMSFTSSREDNLEILAAAAPVAPLG